jgi:hypothetical protein
LSDIRKRSSADVTRSKRDVRYCPESENCLRAYESTPWIFMGQIRRMMARTP